MGAARSLRTLLASLLRHVLSQTYCLCLCCALRKVTSPQITGMDILTSCVRVAPVPCGAREHLNEQGADLPDLHSARSHDARGTEARAQQSAVETLLDVW